MLLLKTISLDAGLFFGQVEPFSGRERVAAGEEREPAGETLSASEGSGRFGGGERVAAVGCSLTPAKRLNLTLGEESCYILEVPRVKIGLPVCVRIRR